MGLVLVLTLVSFLTGALGNLCLLKDEGIYPSFDQNRHHKIFFFYPPLMMGQSAYFRLYCYNELREGEGFGHSIPDDAERVCIMMGGLEEGCPDEYVETTTPEPTTKRE